MPNYLWRALGRSLVVLSLVLMFSPMAVRAQEYFSIEVVGPQRFHIESEVEGKASALVVGTGGPQVVTRQSDGLTSVDARIPVDGKLTLTIGDHGLTIWMNDEVNWEWEEY